MAQGWENHSETNNKFLGRACWYSKMLKDERNFCIALWLETIMTSLWPTTRKIVVLCRLYFHAKANIHSSKVLFDRTSLSPCIMSKWCVWAEYWNSTSYWESDKNIFGVVETGSPSTRVVNSRHCSLWPWNVSISSLPTLRASWRVGSICVS